jgi:hypothetical protein
MPFLQALPQVVEALRPTPAVVAPKPATAKPRPVAPVCVREPKEGTSGYFFKEVFWNLDADERRGKNIIMNGNAALKD